MAWVGVGNGSVLMVKERRSGRAEFELKCRKIVNPQRPRYLQQST